MERRRENAQFAERQRLRRSKRQVIITQQRLSDLPVPNKVTHSILAASVVTAIKITIRQQPVTASVRGQQQNLLPVQLREQSRENAPPVEKQKLRQSQLQDTAIQHQ